ncbi:MAG: hypothetical protein IJ438_10530 [Clostridia bacterium]|nr:hypothetical protein [Clostridia bacterium]
MTISPADVMRHVRHHFVSGYADGAWTLQDGTLTPSAMFSPGEWIAIAESGVADGVYQLDEHGRIPAAPGGAWQGRIWHLTPPADFLRLCDDIRQWVQSHPDPTVTSERFGEYSRSQHSGAWQSVFRERLAPYMRMYAEVKL